MALELYSKEFYGHESMCGMNAIANGWLGAVLNLALVVGMVYSRSERVERILFAMFVLLSAFTVRMIVIRARRRNLH